MTTTVLRKWDWLCFEVPDTRILDGFVQDISPDGRQVKIGKAPDSLESEWFRLADLTIFKTQEFEAMT